MEVYKIEGRFLGENTYFAVKGKDCMIIDPGADPDRILSFVGKKELNIRAVLLTHAHIDHIFGLSGLMSYPIYIHEEDAKILNTRSNLALAFGISFDKIENYTVFSGEIYHLSLPPFEVDAIYTPGHTAGSVCYYTEGILFSGDTLFAGSYGRTDLPTGDEQDLLCSIVNELFELPPETPVYAGHSDSICMVEKCDADTTIGAERVGNPILELL